ncbi:MAG: CGNR zinc finger domain-containing protein [Gammaproteobacteria bacterium]|nr:CGNR zinc finger domain-containing protein [Gammaproteobacteria bacterium]MBU2059524.1 CGNR zinc finger domain-containing protein [Gammaproteobacteria bacterium]MBU2176182.1 CGNR zinc finger domain-containing protein [Gammaproteobacteria bacterium]MBU2248115.1 CGNR zinc finger domain-containing protein [Gammaproteobacteria bacterium]MBU2344765.1 CGNR zinc finger domain-containing protein [Gammaproteobacteria bacterium]
MAISAILHEEAQSGAPMLGDHLAMDLLNTEARDDGKAVEFWNTDADVLQWLARYDINPTTEGKTLTPGELLTQAKALRVLARQLISEFREEKSPDISKLNQYLHSFLTVPTLERDHKGQLVLNRVSRSEIIGSLLGPVAEAVAQLLVEGNFDLVKQCEHPDCILWFYDRTKAHKRRWCSMALCGNRHKAAQFRKRSSS